MATVRFSGVNKSYGSTSVVSDLNIELPDGSFTVLVGPSGCGKSTSLRMLAGLESVTSGTIAIGDRDVTDLQPRDRDVAMVFQNYALYPHLTVRENIAFPLRASKTPRGDALKRADEVAESLGLGKLLGRKPKDLSGGQQQRVAIGRAIIREPSVFLFDEPLSNLDAKLRVETRTELLQIQRRLGITSVYVTHDQEEAMTLSDHMVVMRDGRTAQEGTPLDVYANPADTFVATFVGSPKMNLLDGELTGEYFTLPTGFTIGVESVDTSGPVTLGVRPDDLVLTASDGDGAAQVKLIELLGPRAIVTIDARGTELTSVVEAGRLSGIGEGARVTVSARPGAVHVFDPETGQRHVGNPNR
ncbi:ABC transporter ATP-binding protein [Mycobacterium sp. URHB0021]|jgi:multiple sugar transport system ATP-binding protein